MLHNPGNERKSSKTSDRTKNNQHKSGNNDKDFNKHPSKFIEKEKRNNSLHQGEFEILIMKNGEITELVNYEDKHAQETISSSHDIKKNSLLQDGERKSGKPNGEFNNQSAFNDKEKSLHEGEFEIMFMKNGKIVENPDRKESMLISYLSFSFVYQYSYKNI